MSELLVIPMSQVRENPVALRSVNRESEAFLGLRDSISEKGILNPIGVRRKVDTVDGVDVEYFEVVDGLHRYTAACEAGLTEIPVSVLALNDAAVLEAQIMANVHKIDTKPIEYTNQMNRILGSNPTMTISEMAQRLSKSPSWVSQRLGLLKLVESIQELVDEGRIKVSNAIALCRLPADEQVNFVDQAMSMTPEEFVPTVQARAKELRQAAAEGRKAEPASFKPTPRSRKLSDLKDEYDSLDFGKSLDVHSLSPVDAYKLGIAFAISLDPVSVAAQQSVYDERKRATDDAKKARAAERAKKKAEEAAATAAKLQEELEG